MRMATGLVAAILLAGVGYAGQQAQPPVAQPAPAQSPAAQAPAVAKTPSPADFNVPPDASKAVNPVRPTPESLARGKKSYGQDCAMCHGVTGDGKGDLAGDMKLTLADLRDPATLRDFTNGDLFYIIMKGKDPMQGEEGRRKPNDVWDIVNYVRSLAKKPPAANHKPATQ